LYSQERRRIDFVQAVRRIIIPSPIEIVGWIAEYFAAHRRHTADILAGPKRETWFSSESFVALSLQGKPHPDHPLLPAFSCWGEQEFGTIFKLIAAKRGGGDHRRKPDIVCYRPVDGIEAVSTVIEIKLVRNDENPEPCLNELKEQLSNARLLFSDADLLGLVFLAAAPFTTPRTWESASKRLNSAIASCFPRSGCIATTGSISIFEMVPTQFHYPEMYVSLEIASVTYSSSRGVRQ
jgi:hypothetical protein